MNKNLMQNEIRGLTLIKHSARQIGKVLKKLWEFDVFERVSELGTEKVEDVGKKLIFPNKVNFIEESN